ncbi:MAG: HAMP domain-containing histidine kinase [Micrococcales bacterium]|nr:HAMP domain-containing histidine kinase [Micrococcales bacterium]
MTGIPTTGAVKRAAVMAVQVGPGLLGLVVGLALLLGDDDRTVQLQAPLWVCLATVGLVVSALVVTVVRDSRLRSAQAAAVAGAVRTTREEADVRARAEHRTFVSRLDHELKNPVMAIRTAAGVMRTGEVDEQLIGIVDSQSARIALLVADLRKLSDLETAEIAAAPVALEPLIDDVVTVMRDEIRTRGLPGRAIEVQLPRIPWSVPDVSGDADLLFLAVYNLLANAVKYSAPGASIIVRAMEGSGGVTLEIADTGQGIPADEVDAVWDELQRGSNARGLPGSGLGLPLVRTIVERHGGRVQLLSREGRGTSVRLWLPFGPAASRPAVPTMELQVVSPAERASRA